jgi:tetratricopeptide (TPR) repeat protein
MARLGSIAGSPSAGPPVRAPREIPLSPPPGRVHVDEFLRALPDREVFQLLRDQVLAHSSVDPGKRWASSSAYLTYDKRSLTPAAVADSLEATLAAGKQFYGELYEALRAVMEAVARRDSSGTVRSLVALGEIFERHQRRYDARSCYEKALELGESLTDSGPHLLAMRRMGRLCQSFGELDPAFAFYQSAYNRARDAQNVAEAADAAIGLGNVRVDQGMWEQAAHHYTNAIRHAEEKGDQVRLGQLWNNLSVVHRHMGHLDSATQLSRRAIEVFERLENSGELSRCYNNLGLTQVEEGEFELGLRSYERAVSLADTPFVLGAIHANLCELYLKHGKLLLAEEEARRGEEIALRHGFQLILVNIYRLLGSLSRLRHDPNGLTFFEKALEISRDHQYPHVEAEVHFDYGRFRETLREREEAIAQFEKALEIYRSLDAKNDVKRVEERLGTYALERSAGAAERARKKEGEGALGTADPGAKKPGGAGLAARTGYPERL